ncbi:probable serine/threonine-protein kinase At1g54610 [Lolium rigidum]|uniref:probable serine/threonine-protein kinase At1g54610 n=1 Tax=Lolium rigidum TaxID=89674 RepID=UPI001F5D4A79|nr:probable serine/threonine-protein kinase At1g54610 [Lolium rigidum]
MKIHIRCLRSSGRALNVFVGQLCSKCTRQDDTSTMQSQTTASTCIHGLFTASGKDESTAVAEVAAADGNTEVSNVQLKEKSVIGFDPPRKPSKRHRLKIWISTRHSGVIGRCGNKTESSIFSGAKRFSSEHSNAGWPDWLLNVAPEAVQGWAPRRVDSFEKISKIGQGTYSSVYKARDLKTGKVVALKKVRFVNSDPESVRFMAREICILRKLNHPNVIKLEGIVTSPVSECLYLVFEYMEHDLVGLAATLDLKFTESQVKCLLQQILSGLDHCHSIGVLHRDMKGANLLIDSNGVLKIADFGLATLYDPGSQQPMTSRVATLWYRPPELLLGATRYSAAVDMWSTGCIFAELLTGKPIMPGRTEVEQIHKIFKLCGSPSDEYWQKLEVPPTGMFKPHRQYKRCIAENFKDLPPAALALLDNLLAFEPEARGTAASTLQSDFFRTEPLACSPSCLPKCPPSKEYDARLRQEEAKRQRKAESVRPGIESPRENHTAYGPIKSKRLATDTKFNNTNLNPKDDPPALVNEAQPLEFDSTWNKGGNSYTTHHEVPERKYRSARVANSIVSRTSDSDLLQPESTNVRNGMPAARNKDKGAKGPMTNCKGMSKRIHYSGSIITKDGNMEDILREHERNIQEAVRKARGPIRTESCKRDE